LGVVWAAISEWFRRKSPRRYTGFQPLNSVKKPGKELPGFQAFR
jgi:hypothetical protein